MPKDKRGKRQACCPEATSWDREDEVRLELNSSGLRREKIAAAMMHALEHDDVSVHARMATIRDLNSTAFNVELTWAAMPGEKECFILGIREVGERPSAPGSIGIAVDSVHRHAHQVEEDIQAPVLHKTLCGGLCDVPGRHGSPRLVLRRTPFSGRVAGVQAVAFSRGSTGRSTGLRGPRQDAQKHEMARARRA